MIHNFEYGRWLQIKFSIINFGNQNFEWKLYTNLVLKTELDELFSRFSVYEFDYRYNKWCNKACKN